MQEKIEQNFDKEILKKQIIEIFDDLDGDIYDAFKLINQYGEDVKFNNEVQRSLINRLKKDLQREDFDLDDINPYLDLLWFREILELDEEIKDLAREVFYNNKDSFSIEDLLVFLNTFNLSDEKDIVAEFKYMVKDSIKNHNDSAKELADYLEEIVKFMGYDTVEEELEVVLSSLDEYESTELRERLSVYDDRYKDSEVYRT